ncbi:MAG: penicillin-binding protein 2 [Oligoflexales bacterium]|nr:penicillin-binding protein 2 [Oligoflexales bacterium]
MKLVYKHDNLLIEKRFLLASIIILVVACSLLIRLWYLQVYQGEYYKEVSERNRVRKTEIPAPRGIMYDRYGEILLGNRHFFDLVLIPQYVHDKNATFQILSRLLHVSVDTFERQFKNSETPKFLPVVLKRNLSLHEVSTIENNKVFLPGVEIKVVPRRDYKASTPPHLVGYLKEIDPEGLQKFNLETMDNPYLPGDLVGKQGLEFRWEKFLRGRRGYRLIQVDAFGRQSHVFEKRGWQLPVVQAIPGADIELTIDLDLQNTVKEAFNGKNGAVIVMNPQTGEILADLSEPGFDPERMQTAISGEEWRSLTSNPFKPFLDKTTGGEFPPGSIYKILIAIAALQEKVITPSTTFFCPGHYSLGNQVYYCHQRRGHGMVDLKRAVQKSCDVFFYHVGVELGPDRIAKYARAFGLGKILGLNLNMERPGLIPTEAWKQLVYKAPWAKGDTPNIAIGQGYTLMTPIQMVSLYSSIANGGKVFRPFLTKRVTNHVGETIFTQQPQLIQSVDLVTPDTFNLIREYLQGVVMDPEGTGHNAYVPGVTIAGKTGSVQVVSLEKNRNQTDVSMKWKEHAIFVAFSPTENAEIAVVIVSENDKVGGGGRSAAPVAQKIIKAYWENRNKREKIALNKENPAEKENGKKQ